LTTANNVDAINTEKLYVDRDQHFTTKPRHHRDYGENNETLAAE